MGLDLVWDGLPMRLCVSNLPCRLIPFFFVTVL